MTEPGAAIDTPIVFNCALDRPGFTLDAAFTVGPGLTALFGPSGCGKSTIVRLIAGLERPRSGQILLRGQTVADVANGIFVPPHRRRVSVVFQDAHLFPHLTVERNLVYGRDLVPMDQHFASHDDVISVLGIDHLRTRYPATLSGGERQRVAIGRAILAAPRLLVMDEPLSSLDTLRKLEILPFIETVRDRFNVPILYVTHAIAEVVRLASRVVRLENGRVTGTGLPAEMLGHGAGRAGLSRFALTSLLTGRIARYDEAYAITVIDHPAGEIIVPGRVVPGLAGVVRMAVPAASVTLATGHVIGRVIGHVMEHRAGASSGPSTKPSRDMEARISIQTRLNGEIAAIERDLDGPFARVAVTLAGGETLQASLTRRAIDALSLRPGDQVCALVKAVAIDESGVSGHAGV